MSAAAIHPTVGRKLYFWPPHTPTGAVVGAYNIISTEQPFDATIIYVHSRSEINVMVTDHLGNMRFHGKVPLVQEGETVPTGRGHCAWMPYQAAVAKGTIEPVQHATPKTE